MAQLFASAIDEALPASALKQHKNLTIVLDREAAALLPEQALKNAV
jgi:glucosamine-6-phosphate deaminase